MPYTTPPEAGHYLDEFDAERFWDRVNFNGGDAHKSDRLATAVGDCWIYTGALTEMGYGRFRLFGNWQAAHRIAFKDMGNKLDDDLVLDHLCRVHNCLRPSHVEPVTQLVNMQRGANAMQTHCRHGHEYTTANTRRDSQGFRRCAECAHARYEHSKQSA